MIKNFFLISVRNMMKNRLFIFINIFGLAISIACCLVAYFLYDFNQSFDRYHENASTIYRVSSIREFQNQKTKYGHVPIGLGSVMRQNVTELDNAIRFQLSFYDFRINDDVFNSLIGLVDPEFFKVFTFEFVEGNGTITNKNQIAISETLAKKYFGDEKALGKTLNQSLDSGKYKSFTIIGVFKKPPFNTSFNFDAYTHFDNQFDRAAYTENSWVERINLFVQVPNSSRITTIESQIKPYTENNNLAKQDFIISDFVLEPFVGMGVRDSYSGIQGSFTNQGAHIAAIYGTAIMSLFILLIACFNLTNTAIAVSSRRLKEIGIRKVMGSTRKNLIMQFIGETAFICFIALLLGILIGEWLLIPSFNAMWTYWQITPDYFGRPNFLMFTAATLLVTALLAGGYPAFYISKFQPVAILKDKLTLGGTNFFTRSLLTIQFIISIVGIVCSLAFISNANYQKEYDLGYDKKGVTYTFLNNKAEYETFRNRLLQNPDVISVAGSRHHINASSFKDPIKYEGTEMEVIIMDVGDEYVKTMGFELIEGRDFILNSQTDMKESVLITENLASEWGWHDPIGKEVVWMDTAHYRVIGVIKNVLSYGLMAKADPMMLRYQGTEDVRYIIASAPIDKITGVQAEMEAIYRDMFPERVPNIRLMDEAVVMSNEINNNILKMFVFLGAVALLLSATGLFAMVSLNIVRKMKEIGVRKVLGASAFNLSKVINLEFVIILLIASILGGYAGGWMAGMLMDSIWDYFQKVTVITMTTGGMIMLITCALTIAYKVIKTIRLNPSHVLRSE